MSLPLREFAEVTKGLNLKTCIPGFDPAAFLLNEPQLADTHTTNLLPWLIQQYSNGSEIFDGWVKLAVEQWAAECPDEFRAWQEAGGESG